jgi:hypothetical protein
VSWTHGILCASTSPRGLVSVPPGPHDILCISLSFGLWLKDFGWNLSSLCELDRISYIRFIFTYDLVEIPWLIREIGQMGEGVDFEQLGLELLCPHLVNYPPGRHRLSTWSSSAGCSSSSSRVLECLPFDPFRLGFCLEGVCRTVCLG